MEIIQNDRTNYIVSYISKDGSTILLKGRRQTGWSGSQYIFEGWSCSSYRIADGREIEQCWRDSRGNKVRSRGFRQKKDLVAWVAEYTKRNEKQQ